MGMSITGRVARNSREKAMATFCTCLLGTLSVYAVELLIKNVQGNLSHDDKATIEYRVNTMETEKVASNEATFSE